MNIEKVAAAIGLLLLAAILILPDRWQRSSRLQIFAFGATACSIGASAMLGNNGQTLVFILPALWLGCALGAWLMPQSLVNGWPSKKHHDEK